MRRLVAWIGGTVGGITAYRLLRRRAQTAPEPLPSEAAPAEFADARAEELRTKLAESRVAESVVDEPVPEEPAAEGEAEGEPAAAEPTSLEERRHQVHEEARAALDEMRPGQFPPEGRS